MKKSILGMLAVAIVACFASCGGSKAPQASFKTTEDSISYAFGVIQSARMGFNQLVDNKENIIPGATINFEEFIAGLYEYALGDSNKVRMTPEEAGEFLDSYVERYNNIKADSAVQAGVKFMAENGTKEGVQTIDVEYVDQEGNPNTAQLQILKTVVNEEGTQVTNTSIVTLSYEGTLTDGTRFDGNDSVRWDLGNMGLIKGFTEGLINMKKGETAEITFPCELGYGKQSNPRSQIPAGSVLRFLITVKDVENAE